MVSIVKNSTSFQNMMAIIIYNTLLIRLEDALDNQKPTEKKNFEKTWNRSSDIAL